MKISPFLAAIPLLLLGGTSAPSQETIDPQLLTGNLRLTLKNGVWKLWQDQPVYQKFGLKPRPFRTALSYNGKSDNQAKN